MGKKKRSWASLLLAGLVLLTVRPAAAAEASRQESIRILFEELVEQEKNGTSMSAEEAAARSQCTDPACAHVSVDEEGNVTALCPYGQYLLSVSPYMVFSANPVTELALQPGTNSIYRSGTYRVTGGDGACTLVVTKGRAVSLLLDGASLGQLKLSDGSAAALQLSNGASLNEIVPVNAALDLSGTVTVQTVSAGSLTVNGSGRLNVGSLNAAISGGSTGSVRIVYQSCGADALRQLQKLTLSGGERFADGLPVSYRGTEIPLVMSADPEKSDTAYAALPAPEDGKTYKARVSGEQILVYLSDEPQEYVLSANAATVLNVEGSAAVLTSEENAAQSAVISAAQLTLQSARTTGSLSLSGTSAFRAEGSSAFSRMILDASAHLSLRVGGRLSLDGLVNNGRLAVQGSGVLETGELSGSGAYTIDPQCNFSVEPLPASIGGLVPTQIQILGDENAPVAATRVQLKLGSGESFLTTTDSRGRVTLWRSEKLNQVDAVALSGGETYSAVILNGQAEINEAPEITAASLTNRGVVSVTLKNAGVWGVQYVVGDAPVSLTDSWNASAQTLYAADGETTLYLPGLELGDVVSLRVFAAREKDARLSAATADAFTFYKNQSITIESRAAYEPAGQSKTYNGQPFQISRLPRKCKVAYFLEDGTPLQTPPTKEGSYYAEITVLEDDPEYLPGKAVMLLEIKRRIIYVYALDATKQKGEDDPEFEFDTDELCGRDRLQGRLTRAKGEGYGNYAYLTDRLTAVDENGHTVNHYRFVLSPDSGHFFIDWNYHHYLPFDPLSVIDPVYEEIHFSDGTSLKVQYRLANMLNLDKTYFGSIIRDTESGEERPFTPSLRLRRGRDEALLILTPTAEMSKDGGYRTDGDGNPLWQGRTLRLGYWHLQQLQKKHVEHVAFSLNGVTLTFSVQDLLSDGVDQYRRESGLPKGNTVFRFDLIPVFSNSELSSEEQAACGLQGDGAPLMRVQAWLENGSELVDLSPALSGAQIAFDISALATREETAASSNGETETVNGQPVQRAQQETVSSLLQTAYATTQREDATQQELDEALQVWQETVQQTGCGLHLFRNEQDETLSTRLIVPYTLSEQGSALYAALMRTKPYLTAAFQQSGLYGCNLH